MENNDNKTAMQPVRRSRGRSVRQNFPWKQFRVKDNGQSGNRMGTHPERGAGATFSENS
jgi:hypothetical protein